MNILQATVDAHLFARLFRHRDTWQSWFAFLAAVFSLPMTPDQLDLYRRCTGRTEQSRIASSNEAWIVCGRRAGKSFVLALIAVFLACFKSYGEYLAPGERGTVLIIATDRRQARTIVRYIRALLNEVAMLATLIERETAEPLTSATA